MSPYILMTRLENNQAKQNKFSFMKYGMDNKIAALLALIIILGGFYVFQINRLAVLGYEIKEEEKDLAKFKKEVVLLQLDVEKMKAASNLNEKTKDLNMVQAQKVGYIYVSDGNLALNNNSQRY